jgi:hypothetical protein
VSHKAAEILFEDLDPILFLLKGCRLFSALDISTTSSVALVRSNIALACLQASEADAYRYCQH